MPFVPDRDARAAEELSPDTPNRVLHTWIRRLLDDRKERIVVEQRLCRRLAYMGRRLKQAATYFQDLTTDMHREARSSWRGVPDCTVCGAPAEDAGEARPAAVVRHPDGWECKQPVPEKRPPASKRDPSAALPISRQER